MREYNVPACDALQRLDQVVVKICDGISRSTIKKMIGDGLIKVNGESSKANYLVKEADIIRIEPLEVKVNHIEPENIKLNIVYEDADLLVVNKPTGLVVHPGANIHQGTLVNALLYHINELSSINGSARPGIVHRIDKETSGLLIVAKNDRAHQSLAKQLSAKTLHREYYALVHGQILEKYNIIDAPIGRHQNDRTKMAVSAHNSKHALTKVEVIELYDNYSLVKCQLETGRTHQIRVHLNYINHPIVGDPKYGYRKDDHSYGQYLHAYKLGFIHPSTNEQLEFTCDLEERFKAKLEEIKHEG